MTLEIRLAVDSRNGLATVIAALAHHGLIVVRSFDLRSALRSGAGCTCPDHGTDACQCQYAVLLVYGPDQVAGQPPTTVTFHSRAATWLEIGRDATALDTSLTEPILAALAGVIQSTRMAEGVEAPYAGDIRP